MAGRGRSGADDALAIALASGMTIRDAAAAAGVSERTATRRAADPEFRQLVLRHRGELTALAVGKLAASMADAAKVLGELLGCETPAVKLRAAWAILKLGMEARESVELEERIRALEDAGEPQEGARGT